MVGSDISENFNLEQVFQTIPEEIHDDLIKVMLQEKVWTSKLEELPEELIARINSVMQGNPLTKEGIVQFDDVFMSELRNKGGSEDLSLAFAGSYRCPSGKIVANPSLCFRSNEDLEI